MAYSYAAPIRASKHNTYCNDDGLILTFIVPARACNLNCDFCVIQQRKEALENSLGIFDYQHFLEVAIQHHTLAAVGIQGYEPLLSDSWGYTKAIMEIARDKDLPRSFITNGTYLSKRADDILALDVTGMSVSIDSSSPQKHDALRGLAGAFELTTNGLRDIIAKDATFAELITIASVLMPGQRDLLAGMPRLLAELGLTSWSISPLVEIGRDFYGGPVDAGQKIVEDVIWLSDIAKTYGVQVMLDDELRSLPRHNINFGDLIVRTLDRPDGLLRLTPNGACSVGADILKEVDEKALVWDPQEMEPHRFVELVQENYSLDKTQIAA